MIQRLFCNNFFGVIYIGKSSVLLSGDPSDVEPLVGRMADQSKSIYISALAKLDKSH